MIVCPMKNFIYEDKVNGAKSGQDENKSYISTMVILTHDTEAFNAFELKKTFAAFKNDDFAVAVSNPTTDYGYNRIRIDLCHLHPVSSEVLDADYNYEVAAFVLNILTDVGVHARAEFSITSRTVSRNYSGKRLDKENCPRNF